MRFVQKAQSIQELLCEDADKRCTQPAELVLLDELVEVDAEELEGKTEMLAVNEGVLQAQEMVVVILIVFAVEL